MVVRTDTEQVKKIREANLGFILINHPLDCPICDKGGECPLQDQTLQFGPGVSQFVEVKRHKQKHYPISDLILLDQERCILCWRCIRYLEEWEDKPQLGLFERGGETVIDTFPGEQVDAKTSGNICDICPVGALTNRVARFRYRPWEIQKTPSVCTLCPVGCNLRLDERVHTLRRIVARENMAVNDEWICDKGRFLHQYVDHPERLRTPLVRDAKGGELRPATWDEALARVVERLGAVIDEKGASAVGGVASARVSNEAAYLFQKFFRTLAGTNNVDFPDGSGVRAQAAGLSNIADIAKSDLIVLVGFDPSEATPLLDLHIKRAVRRKGARLLIINPRRIELAKYPGAYLPALPGNEAVLLNELAAAIQAGKAANQRISESTNQRAARSAGQATSQPVTAAVRNTPQPSSC
jgi:NADH dehydrogenase/NADH:ubiquinone oxidoreductase subunit G